MQRLPRLVPVVLAAVALLAGCAAPVPHGTANDLQFTPTLAGTVVLDFQPFEGANPTGGTPAGPQAQCLQGQVPMSPVPACRGPWTALKANLTLPMSMGGKYALVFVNATGERQMLDLAEGAQAGNLATYSGAANVTEDLTGRFNAVELRLGSFVAATAPATEGEQMFALAPTATAVRVADLAWSGPALSGTVSGLAANATYQANLYLPGPDGKALPEPSESFPLPADGAFSYTSPTHAIGDFAEFHVHVGHSKLNLYKAAIEAST